MNVCIYIMPNFHQLQNLLYMGQRQISPLNWAHVSYTSNIRILGRHTLEMYVLYKDDVDTNVSNSDGDSDVATKMMTIPLPYCIG